MTVAKGIVTVIIGPNGGSQVHALKARLRLSETTNGRCYFEGQSLLKFAPENMLKHGIAYLPQGRGIFPSMTVHENLKLGGWLFGKDKVSRTVAIEKIYGRYPMLQTKKNVVAGALSGGEQRTLEIARLIMMTPRMVLFDEPTVGLMPKLVDEVYENIVLLKQQAYTILLVDQNIRKALDIADHVFVFENGRSIEDGPKTQFNSNMKRMIEGWL